MKHPQITEILHRENLLSDREKQGKHREFENQFRVGTLH